MILVRSICRTSATYWFRYTCTINVDLPCIDLVLTRSSTVQCNCSGSNGQLLLNWIYSATKWGLIFMDHLWTVNLPVFIAAQLSMWHLPISWLGSVPNYSYIPRRPVSTSRGIGDVNNIVSLTRILADNIHLLPFFFYAPFCVLDVSWKVTLFPLLFLVIHEDLFSIGCTHDDGVATHVLRRGGSLLM